jgi:hypothetical protein
MQYRTMTAPALVMSVGGGEGRGDDAKILPAAGAAPLRSLDLRVDALLQALSDKLICVATTIEVAPYTPAASAEARLRLRAERLRRDGFAIRTPGAGGGWHTLVYGLRDAECIDELSIEAGDDETGPRDFDREAAAAALAAWGKAHALMQLWYEGHVQRTAPLEDSDALLCNVLQY